MGADEPGAEKLARLRTVVLPLLRCTICRTGRLTLDPSLDAVTCDHCDHRFAVVNAIPLLVGDPSPHLAFDADVIRHDENDMARALGNGPTKTKQGDKEK